MPFFHQLLELIFPPRCLRCDAPSGPAYFCKNCSDAGVAIAGAGPCCLWCGKPIAACVCNPKPWDFSAAAAPVLYEDWAREGILRLKNSPNRRLLGYFGEEMAKTVRTHWREIPFSALIPVPQTPARQEERGFNQAELLAKEVGRHLSLPLRGDCLIREELSQVQHALTRPDRQENARQSYHAAPNLHLSGETLLLVDDVMTTGATLHWCANALLTAGAGKVYAITATTVGRTLEEEPPAQPFPGDWA